MPVDTSFQLGKANQREFGSELAVVGIALAILTVLSIFWPTTRSMIEIWQRSDTFQHCFLVIPISLWLIWRERNQLALTPAQPFWPGLALLVVLGAAWLFGVLATAQVISQFATIAMIGAVVLTVFGRAWATRLWFPLLFLFFAVPFGEALVPQMVDWTADFTVAALRMSGVPVYREGNHFVIPSGQWSVIEACSGVKFLIASLMAGALYMWLMYRSTSRRLAFIAASIIAPFVANWLRAYFNVLIAHLTNNRLMTGPDHLVFGWLLFGAVMLLLYGIGARWREDDEVPDATRSVVKVKGRQSGTAAVLVLAVLGSWPPVAAILLAPVGDASPVSIAAPVGRAGWKPVTGTLTEWSPELVGQAAERTFSFERGADRVGLFIGVFRHQDQMAQLASTANRLVVSTNPRWKQTSREWVETRSSDAAVPSSVHAARLRGAQDSSDQIRAWHWYWIGSSATTSDARSKIELALRRLLRQPDTGLWISVYSPLIGDSARADRVMQDFVRDMGPSLTDAFSQTTVQ